MRLNEKGMELAILHIENQSGISNVMPLRDMGYIYSDYQNQLRALKEENRKAGRHYVLQEIGDDQKLSPVIMLVLYYGTEKWTGPTRLVDMLVCLTCRKNTWLQSEKIVATIMKKMKKIRSE